MAITYKDAGVDVERGYKAVDLIKEHVKKTFDQHVITGPGSFGGIYDIGNGQVLVAGTDGVGTKLKLAFATGKNDTVGVDCVAMCANDVVCHGAKPIVFLDYIATGELVPEVAADIVKGVADGCVQAGCALIGGETAEMPGFYADGEYDMAGFCVGIVRKDKMIDGSKIKVGDALIGLQSSGVHSNGFSLVRKLYAMDESLKTKKVGDQLLSDMLLAPTRIYVKSILELIEAIDIHGIAHITGGGFYENIPRMLPKGACAHIKRDSWDVPPVIDMVVKDAELSEDQAFNTFNMGIGMVIALPDESVDDAIAILEAAGENAFLIGDVKEGNGGVELWG